MGTIMLIVVLYETITSNQAYPLNWAPWVVIAWLVIGGAVMLRVQATNPAALEAGSTGFVLSTDEKPA